MKSSFADLPVLDPRHEAAILARYHVPPPAQFGFANSLSNPLGQHPARGYVLLSRQSVNVLAINSRQQWVIEDDLAARNRIAFKNLIVVSSRSLTPASVVDPNACCLVEVADRRWLCHNPTYSIPINQQYNVRAPAYGGLYYADSLNGGTAWTWTQLAESIWNFMLSQLGTFPGLPFTPDGTPEGWKFIGTSAWLALCQVLWRVGCAVSCDLTADAQYSIVRVGVDDAAATALIAKSAGQKIQLYDEEFSESAVAKTPYGVRIFFHKVQADYGAEQTTQRTTAQFTTASTYTVDIAGTALGTEAGIYHPVWDDLPALLDASGAVTNAAALATRAQERADDFFRMLSTGGGKLRKAYSGIVPFKTGSTIKGVAWRQVADGGLSTELVSHPFRMLRVLENGNFEDYEESTSLHPPDYRPTFPNYPQLLQKLLSNGTTPDGDGHYDMSVLQRDPATLAWNVKESVWGLEQNSANPIVASRRYDGRLSGYNNGRPEYTFPAASGVAVMPGLPGGGYVRVQDEGSNLAFETILNFIGTTVTAADDAGNTRTNVTHPDYATATPNPTSTAGNAGVATQVSRGDHVHALGNHDHTSTTGDGGVLTNDEHDAYSEYTPIAAPATPAATKGRLYLETDTTASREMLRWKDDAAANVGIGRDVGFLAFNNSGSTIATGAVVYITGANSNYPTIALAKANSSLTMPAAGFTAESISNSAYGWVRTHGRLTQTAGAVGTGVVYVSPTTAGSFTITKPGGTNIAQPIGISAGSTANDRVDLNFWMGSDLEFGGGICGCVCFKGTGGSIPDPSGSVIYYSNITTIIGAYTGVAGEIGYEDYTSTETGDIALVEFTVGLRVDSAAGSFRADFKDYDGNLRYSATPSWVGLVVGSSNLLSVAISGFPAIPQRGRVYLTILSGLANWVTADPVTVGSSVVGSGFNGGDGTNNFALEIKGATTNGLVSDIVVAGPAKTAKDLVVKLNGLVHTIAGHLIASITHTDTGKSIDLFRNIDPGGGGTPWELSNFNGDYRFSDAAEGNIWTEAGLGDTTYDLRSGSYFPSDASGNKIDMAQLQLDDWAGTWRLTIIDCVSGTTGTLGSWEICFGEETPATDLAEDVQAPVYDYANSNYY